MCYPHYTQSHIDLQSIRMLSYSLGCSATSALSGVLVTRTGMYRPVIWVAYAVFAVGMGLMIMLDSHSSAVVKVIFPLIPAIGLGALFQVSPLMLCGDGGSGLSVAYRIFFLQTPLIGLQAAMPIKDMATSTGTYGFIRLVIRGT